MTYEELLQAMLNKVPGSVDKREGSVIYDALAPCAYFLAQQNFQLENYLDLVFPDTAVGEYLDRAVAAFGVTRKTASAAVRKMITTGAVPIGSRWGLNSLVYTVTRISIHSAIASGDGRHGLRVLLLPLKDPTISLSSGIRKAMRKRLSIKNSVVFSAAVSTKRIMESAR